MLQTRPVVIIGCLHGVMHVGQSPNWLESDSDLGSQSVITGIIQHYMISLITTVHVIPEFSRRHPESINQPADHRLSADGSAALKFALL